MCHWSLGFNQQDRQKVIYELGGTAVVAVNLMHTRCILQAMILLGWEDGAGHASNGRAGSCRCGHVLAMQKLWPTTIYLVACQTGEGFISLTK